MALVSSSVKSEDYEPKPNFLDTIANDDELLDEFNKHETINASRSTSSSLPTNTSRSRKEGQERMTPTTPTLRIFEVIEEEFASFVTDVPHEAKDAITQEDITITQDDMEYAVTAQSASVASPAADPAAVAATTAPRHHETT